MKKFIFSALLPLLYFLSLFPRLALPHTTAVAASELYACVCTDSAFFYAAKDERRGLFLLPETYYVKVLSADADFCKIEYLYDSDYTQKLTGYAKTNELTFVDYTPKTPYLTHLFEVRYTLDNTEQDDDSFLNQITLTCAYYGDYKIGSKTYCYILRGDEFGYVPKPDNFTFEKNTEYAEYLAAKDAEKLTPSEPSSKTDSASPAQIAILIVLCLLVPALAALILKPPKRPPYEEE